MDSDALFRLVKGKLTPGEPPEPPGEATASVAIALSGPSLKTLMIKRAEREGDPWSGQVAFPGGRRERQDRSLLETATRETKEEVGIDLRRSAVYLGHLGAFRTHTGTMLVVPCAFSMRMQERVEPNAEVFSYRWIPVEVFLRQNSRSTYTLKRGGDKIEFPAYVYQDYVIWGLSYRMISALLGRE
jgi:8-oxo-dGTP pyrophosphatase MutT (NUDIX family)